MKWTDISFVPDAHVAERAALAWRWLISEPWRPLVSSMFGGIFLEKSSGGVYWLECGMGSVERVASDAERFDNFLRSQRDASWFERIDEWFLPSFVQKLHDAGKKPGAGQCFGLTILPVFEGGKYEVDNVFVVPAHEWLSYTGSMHEQIRNVPDGERVKIVITK